MQFAKIMLLNRTCVNGLILWKKTPLGFNREPERHYGRLTNTCGGLNESTKQKLCYANTAVLFNQQFAISCYSVKLCKIINYENLVLNLRQRLKKSFDISTVVVQFFLLLLLFLH